MTFSAFTLIALCLSLSPSLLVATLPYKVLRLNEDNNNTAFLIISKVAKAVPDDATIVSLGYDPQSLESISLADLNKLKAGEKLASLKYNNQSPDELTRIEIAKSYALQGNLIHDVLDVGNYINPTIVKFQGRLLLAACLSVGFSGAKLKPSNGNIEFRWFNHTDYPFSTTGPYLGIENEIESLPTVMVGQDPRIIVMDDPNKFQIYFTKQLGVKYIRMGMAKVALNTTTNIIDIEHYYHAITPTLGVNLHQKNWSPFLFRNEVLLIQSIQPFLVVKTAVQDGEMVAFHESTTEMSDYYWPYGDVRGGTNAVFLPDKGVYLAFLHSAGHIPGLFMKTYVMGAYTFSAEPPFRVLSMSPYPIMPYRFYDGPWHPIKNRQIDYCVFPMSLMIEKEDVMLSFGYQDQRGYLVRIKLQKLLDTLVPVTTKPKEKKVHETAH